MKISEIIERYTRPGELYEKLEDKKVRCFACANRCTIKDGSHGICHTRYNQGGILQVPFGYVAGAQCDPIEKKPFFHAYPGALAYSFGMLGCNFHCNFCQNWVTSQAFRDPNAVSPLLETTPEELVKMAQEEKKSVA